MRSEASKLFWFIACWHRTQAKLWLLDFHSRVVPQSNTKTGVWTGKQVAPNNACMLTRLPFCGRYLHEDNGAVHQASSFRLKSSSTERCRDSRDNQMISLVLINFIPVVMWLLDLHVCEQFELVPTAFTDWWLCQLCREFYELLVSCFQLLRHCFKRCSFISEFCIQCTYFSLMLHCGCNLMSSNHTKST